MQTGARIRRVFQQPYLVFVLLWTSEMFPSRVYNDYRQRGCPMWREDARSCTLSVALFITRHSLVVYFALTHQEWEHIFCLPFANPTPTQRGQRIYIRQCCDFIQSGWNLPFSVENRLRRTDWRKWGVRLLGDVHYKSDVVVRQKFWNWTNRKLSPRKRSISWNPLKVHIEWSFFNLKNLL